MCTYFNLHKFTNGICWKMARHQGFVLNSVYSGRHTGSHCESSRSDVAKTQVSKLKKPQEIGEISESIRKNMVVSWFVWFDVATWGRYITVLHPLGCVCAHEVKLEWNRRETIVSGGCNSYHQTTPKPQDFQAATVMVWLHSFLSQDCYLSWHACVYTSVKCLKCIEIWNMLLHL